jgi:hypothetical protein
MQVSAPNPTELNNLISQRYGTPSTECNAFLTRILVNSAVGRQNPQIIPQLMEEIQTMPSLMDKIAKNPQAAQAEISNPQLLEMLIGNIRNKCMQRDIDTRHNEANVINNSESTQLQNDLSQRIDTYRQPVAIPIGNGIGNGNGSSAFGEQLASNGHLLPNLESPQLLTYQLSLDFRTDLEVNAPVKYPLKFQRFGNISKISMKSCLLESSSALLAEPYIFVKCEEFMGRCLTSQKECIWAKMVMTGLTPNGFLIYHPDPSSGIQVFGSARQFDRLTLTFLNPTGRVINLREIPYAKVTKASMVDDTGDGTTKIACLKFVTKTPHQLNKNQEVTVHIHQISEIDEYPNCLIEDIIDPNTFIIRNQFDNLTEKITLLKNTANGSVSVEFAEINWNLLNQQTPQNVQLIKLSQLLITHRNQSNHETQANIELLNGVQRPQSSSSSSSSLPVVSVNVSNGQMPPPQPAQPPSSIRAPQYQPNIF